MVRWFACQAARGYSVRCVRPEHAGPAARTPPGPAVIFLKLAPGARARHVRAPSTRKADSPSRYPSIQPGRSLDIRQLLRHLDRRNEISLARHRPGHAPIESARRRERDKLGDRPAPLGDDGLLAVLRDLIEQVQSLRLKFACAYCRRHGLIPALFL